MNQFKGMSGDVNYALVLGNIIHSIFQSILETMDFKLESLNKTIKNSVKPQLLLLYYLKKTEQEVYDDAKRAIKNIQEWLDLTFLPNKNKYGLKYQKFIAAEQEFNTFTYGIKGNIDSTILIKDRDGQEKQTALEIKTGKHKSNSYRGQVILYSLLISERFLNSNPENILLYIMDDNIQEGFVYMKSNKLELESLVMGRNEQAKWVRRNQVNPFVPRKYLNEIGQIQDDLIEENKSWDSIQIVKLPPMIKRPSECKGCFNKEVCSLSAISLEENVERDPLMGQFPTFQDMLSKVTQEVKEYFKKYIECINLEQNAE